MSDMPKGLRTASSYRWMLLPAASLLTVVASALGWNEITTGGSPVPRALVGDMAIVAWVGFVVLCTTLVAVKALIKMLVKEIHREVDRAKQDILQAMCDKRMETLADLMEEDNVRNIHDKRR